MTPPGDYLTAHIPFDIWRARANIRPFWYRRKKMTQHRSLKAAVKITEKRNVLKRFERIDILRAGGKWKDGDRAFGLPKAKAAK